MTTNIEFLKNRLSVIKKRIASTDDYKEMKVLERMITELEVADTLSVASNSVAPKSSDAPRRVDVKTKRGFFPRDTEASVAAHVASGSRIVYIYETVEKIVKEHGGKIAVDKLEGILEKDYGMDWTTPRGDRNERPHVCSYLGIYNKHHEDDQRLVAFPQRKEGKIRVRRYTHVQYVGKERLNGKTGRAISEETRQKMRDARKKWHMEQKKVGGAE